MAIAQSLISLFDEMAKLTEPECAACAVASRHQFRCCAFEYCAMAEELAKEFGVQVQKQAVVDTLPYMGPQGCVMPPYLRPLCTMHTCDINSLGFKTHGAGTQKDKSDWTKAYFALRAKIDRHPDMRKY
jgi:hypothetical protein